MWSTRQLGELIWCWRVGRGVKRVLLEIGHRLDDMIMKFKGMLHLPVNWKSAVPQVVGMPEWQFVEHSSVASVAFQYSLYYLSSWLPEIPREVWGESHDLEWSASKDVPSGHVGLSSAVELELFGGSVCLLRGVLIRGVATQSALASHWGRLKVFGGFERYVWANTGRMRDILEAPWSDPSALSLHPLAADSSRVFALT